MPGVGNKEGVRSGKGTVWGDRINSQDAVLLESLCDRVSRTLASDKELSASNDLGCFQHIRRWGEVNWPNFTFKARVLVRQPNKGSFLAKSGIASLPKPGNRHPVASPTKDDWSAQYLARSINLQPWIIYLDRLQVRRQEVTLNEVPPSGVEVAKRVEVKVNSLSFPNPDLGNVSLRIKQGSNGIEAFQPNAVTTDVDV